MAPERARPRRSVHSFAAMQLLFLTSSVQAFQSSMDPALTNPLTPLCVALTSLPEDDSWSRNRRRKKYQRSFIPESEKEARRLRKQRQKEYDRLMSKEESPSLWSFDSLFPDPIRDEKSIYRDLYEVKDRDRNHGSLASSPCVVQSMVQPKLDAPPSFLGDSKVAAKSSAKSKSQSVPKVKGKVDKSLTQIVESKIFGYRQNAEGQLQYETSLMGDGAIKFRDGVRLGNPLPVNADRLTYMAKKELQKGRVEEAKQLYETAMSIDPRDGRVYLGLSRCAERRRDFKLARECLQAGIENSRRDVDDHGANPFVLQAMGCLEEKMGHLTQAEKMYVAATKSRPWHAAAWVSLAQLRTRKLGQSVAEGRECYLTAARELKYAGKRKSSYVYTAWGDLEFKKGGDKARARELFQAALKVDKKCSAAWLQLGVLETQCREWAEAEKCFESVLKFDQRNSRVLQAYALMESKRPDGCSRKTIGLFERALAANSRDAGVLQAYGLYVSKLGDTDAARNLFRRGTEANKRHAANWQAWGVLETREGNDELARSLFQQGIWSCAQIGGSQSGGHHCARLWQGWGVLEAKGDNDAAARRCFSRALDADARNVPTITAWAQMEAELGNLEDARSVYERSLPKFSPGSGEKMALWQTFENMEKRFGELEASRHVYERSMREAMAIRDTVSGDNRNENGNENGAAEDDKVASRRQVDFMKWNGGGEVWLNDRAIESMMPFKAKKASKMK